MSTWTRRVLALEPVVRRAPSAHNTQPARLHVDGDALVVGWDPARELVVGDPTRRDLWLSLGAFVESVVTAGASEGIGVGVEWRLDARAHTVARLTEKPCETVVFTADELRRRRCARGPYADPATSAAEVADVAATAGAGDGLVVVPVAVVDELLPVADRWSWTPPALVDELRDWMRLDHGDPRYHEDGLSDVALALTPGQSRALRLATGRRVWPLLRRVGGPSLLGAASAISGRGTVVALTAPAAEAATPAQVGELGRLLLRVWLAAGRAGLAVHPLSVLVDSPLTATRLRLALAPEGDDRRVLSVFRIGRPVDAPVESARRPVPVS